RARRRRPRGRGPARAASVAGGVRGPDPRGPLAAGAGVRGGADAQALMRRVAIVGASGNGKTTLGREVARRLEVPFVELDALHHGPNWAEPPLEEFRASVAEATAGDGWVVDGGYERKLGRIVLDRADTIVWLDLPLPVILGRLLRRTLRRIRTREELW